MQAARSPVTLLCKWLEQRLPPESAAWFSEQFQKLQKGAPERDLYIALGYAIRKLGKADLALGPAELDEAQSVRPGWNPGDWSIDQAARLAFVLADGLDGQAFKNRIEQLFRTADIGELITFYRGLPLYPNPELHVAQAREGTRSAMQPIFEAVAHRNPYPKEQFDENAWNHMVLKALFIGSRLDPIDGLDERANPRLMRMLCDYAHERWAAGRPVSPELWRCVGPHADANAVADLERVLTTGNAVERQAAALALAAAPIPSAGEVLAKNPELARAAKAGELSWSAIANAAVQA
mgnify:FL=1